jgi:hypothetical protein
MLTHMSPTRSARSLMVVPLAEDPGATRWRRFSRTAASAASAAELASYRASA